MSKIMNTGKSRRYVRLNRESIQGKFIFHLSIVACAVGVLLAVNYWIIKDKYQRHQQMLEVWVPTEENFSKLSVYIQTGQLNKPEITTAVNALNALSDQWERERMIYRYERLLEQLEALNQTSGISQQELLNSKEYTLVQKAVTELLTQANTEVQTLAKENNNFISYLKSLFFWEYIVYIILGFTLSTLMVMTVMSKIRKLKRQVAAIASGNLSERIIPQNDEFNSMSNSLNQLIDNLKDITNFAGEVGRGNMDASINAFDEKSELGQSLAEMRDSLKKVAIDDKNRRWINEGIAKFAQIVRLHNGNVNELAEAVTGELVKYVGALQGALFISRKDSSGNSFLELSGCYAYDRQKYLKKQIPVNSGLIGQAYLEKAPKYLLEIPKNYDTITTGLGQGSPESILMMPLLHEDRVEGVLELASLRKFEEYELEFLNKVTETMGAAIAAVRINEDTRKLLEQSQGVAEELRSQEEEMRQNMEEMQATQEEMARAQRELIMKETNLNAFINNTTDSIITLSRDYKVELFNNALKDRYKGTQYEGIQKGTDLLSTLGNVAQEWKAYYDKSFAGEYQLFTIKSSVKGEDSWREYQINPIRAKNGEVVSVSVISRDTTEKVKAELQMQQKSAVLNKIIEEPAHAHLALAKAGKIITSSKGIGKYLFDSNTKVRANDNILQLVNPESKQYWEQQIEAVFAGQELFINSQEAGYESVKIKLSPVYGDEGEVVAVLLSIPLA